MRLSHLLCPFALFACAADEAEPDVHVLGAEAQASLSMLVVDPADEALATLRFEPAPAELDGLAVDDHLVSAPIETSAPYGFLYRVVSLERDGGGLTVHGAQAPISDVVAEGEVAVERTITEADIDLEMSTSMNALPGARRAAPTDDDQQNFGITIAWPRIDFEGVDFLCDDPAPCDLSGHITLPEPQFALEAVFDFQGLQRFMFRVAVDAEIELELTGRLMTPALGTDVVVYRLYLTPITVVVGIIPIVFVPRIEFKLGGEISVALDTESAGVSAGAHLVTGIDHVRGQPDRDLSAASAEGEAHSEGQVQTTLIADIYTEVVAGVYIYNGFGPYTYFKQGPNLDFATPRDPFFRLGYRVSMGMGGRFDFIDPSILNIIDISADIFDEIFPMYESSNTPPAILSFSPGTAQFLDINDSLALAVDGYDLEDGTITDDMVSWSSTLDGVLGTGKNLTTYFHDGGPGTRVVTATLTDSHGDMTTRTVEVSLPTATPEIAIVYPIQSGNYVGVATDILALATSPYFATEVFCSSNNGSFAWTSSAPDTFVGDSATSCGGSIVFASVGQRTLTFTATDAFGQSTSAQVTVDVVPLPSCYPTITSPGSGTIVSNSGGNETVQLTATVAAGCPALDHAYFTVRSHLPGGEIREHVYADSASISFTPVSTMTNTGPLLPLMSNTTFDEQPIDVIFTIEWPGGSESDQVGIVYQYIPG